MGLARGGTVNRVVLLSNGEYKVHIIGVNWPHHVFVTKTSRSSAPSTQADLRAPGSSFESIKGAPKPAGAPVTPSAG
jgi:hypothetical protein